MIDPLIHDRIYVDVPQHTYLSQVLKHRQICTKIYVRVMNSVSGYGPKTLYLLLINYTKFKYYSIINNRVRNLSENCWPLKKKIFFAPKLLQSLRKYNILFTLPIQR